MATRNTFTGLADNNPQFDDSQFDPFGAMQQPMPAAPSMPMSGANASTGTPTPAPDSGPSPYISPVAGVMSLPSEITLPGTDVGGTGINSPIETATASHGAGGSSGSQGSSDTNTPGDSGSSSNPPSNYDPATAASELAAEYETALHRHARPDEIQNYLEAVKQYGWEAVKAQIDSSPEAQAYAARNTTPESGLGGDVSGGLQALIASGGLTKEQRSLLERVNAIIASGGHLPEDDAIIQAELERARESESGAFTGQLNDARDELAARGLISEPGAGSGGEGEAITNIQRVLGPQYASAVRDINTNASAQRESRLMSAISTATGITGAGAQQLLSSLGQGTQRQLGLAQIALDSLSQDQQWQEFLANYGLQRDQILNSIQSGNVTALMTLINLFLQMTGQSASGHV